jgi:6-phosphogluconolactonase (cycloisomerase 2 family)
VAVFSRNESTGALSFVETLHDNEDGVDGLDGALSVTVSSDGSHVYIIGNGDEAVLAFSRNETTGALTFADIKMHTAISYGAKIELDGARSAAVSPDGDYVYVAARDDDALAVFERDAGSGALSYVEMIKDGVSPVDGLDGANSVAVSPDGQHIYVASVYDDAVAAFSRDVPTGTLSFVEMEQDGVGGVTALDFATGVAVSPDGKHVYVTSAQDNGITAFSRYSPTGQLAVAHVVEEGDDHGLIVDGLEGAYAVAISPDGYHIYVAGGADDALAVFVRNNLNGHLTFIETVTDTGSLVNGLDRPRSIAVSPDGEHVYVASFDADTLAVYDRNPGSGELTFLEIHQDGYGGVNGLEGAHSVVVSPDGLRVYAAGGHDDVLSVFLRDPSTGQLTLAEEYRDNVGGVHGLEYPASIAVTPSGSHVYVASFVDDAVVAFRRNIYVFLPLVLRSN